MPILQIEDRTLYDLPSLSEKMGVGVYTIRKYVREGKLKAVKVGRKYWVDEKELKHLFKTGTGKPVKMHKG